MTIEEQRYIFQALTPKEFMDVCIYQKEKYGQSMCVCSFIGIRLLQENGEALTPKHTAYIERLTPYFGDLDISQYKRLYSSEKDFRPKIVLKDINSELLEKIKHVHNPNIGIDHSGFIEFIKAQNINLDFSEKNVRNRISYNKGKLKEIFDCFDNFNRKLYRISDDVEITLGTNQFIHILVGHVESYKIPRKGKLVQFKNIRHWKELLLLINKVIDFIKDDLISHFSNCNLEYNNRSIKIDGNQYGIHIGKRKNIKTLYPIE